MKNKAILVVSILIVASLFLVSKYSTGARTIEEAINMHSSKPVNIIYEEKNDKGTIVFSYMSGGNYLYTAVVRYGISGYKTVYSSVQGDIKYVSEKFGLSHSYFPAIEKTALPIYFGVIGNPDISEVKIIDKKRSIESSAKIINANGTRIWLVYMNKFEGSDFDIIGLSADGKELTKIDGDITSNYAEQKPLKGYK